jgi:hypothetical protein
MRLHDPLDRDTPNEADMPEPGQFEAPRMPAWDVGPAPGRLRHFLFDLAGVDVTLARTCPADEQHQIARVGAALLAGLGVQVGMAFAAASVVFGTSAACLAGSLLTTLMICSVLFTFDRLFVAADWITHGVGYVRQYGIPCAGGRGWQRWAGIGLRWAMSGFLAWVLAGFLSLQLFGHDIADQLQRQYRTANAAPIATATARYDALTADLGTRIARADAALAALAGERAQVVRREDAAAAAGQEAAMVAQLHDLATREAAAETQEAAYRRATAAELAGARLAAGNSGVPGAGPKHQMYETLAAQQARIAERLRASIATAKHDLAALRSDRAATAQQRERTTQAWLATIDTEAHSGGAKRAALAQQLQQMADARPAWINAQVQSDPRHVPAERGLIAKIQALWTLGAANPAIEWTIRGMELAIILLETAGMWAKAFFTRCRRYSTCAVLRVDDACRMEAELRARHAAWRAREHERRDAALEPLETARMRRGYRRWANDRARDGFEKDLEP